MSKAYEIALSSENKFCVLAEHQSQGQATHGRIWDSPKGNFYATYAFQNTILDNIPKISLSSGIAIASFLETYNIYIKLKWTNDLLLNLNKVGGILCVSYDNYIFIGIGINFKVLPPSDHNSSKFTPAIIDRNFNISYSKLALDLGNYLEKALEDLNKNEEKDAIEYRWQEYDALLNKKILISLPDNSIKQGINKGVNAQGHLLLQTQQAIEPYYSARIIDVVND